MCMKCNMTKVTDYHVIKNISANNSSIKQVVIMQLLYIIVIACVEETGLTIASLYWLDWMTMKGF